MKNEKKIRAGLIGEKLGHSFSPKIHAALADYSYDLVELKKSALGDFLQNGGYDAFNVTIPYKQAVTICGWITRIFSCLRHLQKVYPAVPLLRVRPASPACPQPM